MTQALLITILAIGALLALLGGRVARRWGLPEQSGIGMALALAGVSVLLAPSHWRGQLVAGEAADRILIFARDIGLTGLFFLAGARFDFHQAWRARRISFMVAGSGMILFAVGAALLAALAGQDRYAAVATAAAVAGASLWMPAQASLTARKGKPAIAAASTFAAVILTAVLMLVVNFYGVFYDLAGRAHSTTAYAVAALYEIVKILVVFSFAYFFASRFLGRAEGRISTMRMTAGYLLLAVLLFMLIGLTTGPLAALAWAFFAGALFTRCQVGKKFAGQASPVATAVFLTLAFLPMILQPHGRRLSHLPALLVVVSGTLVGKFLLAWLAAKLGGASSRDAAAIAASASASAETSVMFLGFAVTRWLIDSPEYYGMLLFALASIIVSPVIRRSTEKKDESVGTETDHAGKPLESRRGQAKRGSSGKKISFAVILLVMTLAATRSTARAQSVAQPPADDPVTRAMKAAESSTAERARAAEVVLAASKYVNESAAARKQGDQGRAREALKQAREVVQAADDFDRSAMIDELARLLAAEQSALDPKSGRGLIPLSADKVLTVALPRSVTARLDQYRNSFAQILQEENVPVGLLGVALVESGFNPFALSPKGARGMWQFMPATAVRYGLAVQPGNDHRTHPEHSTRAAARYLRDLYEMFGDWKLALAAYNWGEGNLLRVINRTGVRNFDELARRGLLPAETRNYVPAVLAAWQRVGGTVPATTQAIVPAKGKREGRSGLVVEALTRPGDPVAAPAAGGLQR